MRKALVFFVFALTCAIPAVAQLVLGNISGTVTDSQSAVVAGAKVVAKNNDTNLTVSASTQSDGRFSINNLPIGKYSVTVSQGGFETQLFSEIVVQANRTVSLDAQLKIGQVATTVLTLTIVGIAADLGECVARPRAVRRRAGDGRRLIRRAAVAAPAAQPG